MSFNSSLEEPFTGTLLKKWLFAKKAPRKSNQLPGWQDTVCRERGDCICNGFQRRLMPLDAADAGC